MYGCSLPEIGRGRGGKNLLGMFLPNLREMSCSGTVVWILSGSFTGRLKNESLLRAQIRVLRVGTGMGENRLFDWIKRLRVNYFISILY